MWCLAFSVLGMSGFGLRWQLSLYRTHATLYSGLALQKDRDDWWLLWKASSDLWLVDQAWPCHQLGMDAEVKKLQEQDRVS